MPDRYLCLKILAAAIDAEICRRQRPAPVAARVAPTLASHGQRPVAALTRHVWHLPNPAQAARRRFALAHAAWPVRPAGSAFHAKRLPGPAFPATPDEHQPPADEKNLAYRRRRRYVLVPGNCWPHHSLNDHVPSFGPQRFPLKTTEG